MTRNANMFCKTNHGDELLGIGNGNRRDQPFRTSAKSPAARRRQRLKQRRRGPVD
jgi:hypothetical protein